MIGRRDRVQYGVLRVRLWRSIVHYIVWAQCVCVLVTALGCSIEGERRSVGAGAEPEGVDDQKQVLEAKITGRMHDGRLYVCDELMSRGGAASHRQGQWWMVYTFVTAQSPNISNALSSAGSVSWEHGRLLGAVGGLTDVMGGRDDAQVMQFVEEGGFVIVTIVLVEVADSGEGRPHARGRAEMVACQILMIDDFLPTKGVNSSNTGRLGSAE